MKSKTLQRISTVLLIIAYLAALFTVIAGATEAEESKPLTIMDFLDGIFAVIQLSSEVCAFLIIAWVIIQIIKINHFFKLFTIAKQTEITNKKLEKIIQIQQRQLDLLIHDRGGEASAAEPPAEDPPRVDLY